MIQSYLLSLIFHFKILFIMFLKNKLPIIETHSNDMFTNRRLYVCAFSLINYKLFIQNSDNIAVTLLIEVDLHMLENQMEQHFTKD